MPTQTVMLEGTVRPDQEKTYYLAPFEVPPGTARLEVECSYSDRIGSDPHLTGGNTIDLGLFDPRGAGFPAVGFRGWSGSERLSFFITETEATPGYLAGPLPPGRWHLLLGLYKIGPGGCAYQAQVRVTVASGHVPAPEPVAPPRDLPAAQPAPFAPWLRGELHCHSWHSDGELSPAELVALARQRGLDFLAVSDHNTTAAQRDLAQIADPGLVLLRGLEVTTYHGHFNAWGILDWVDFRVQEPAQMVAALRFAREHGAVIACNHPKPFGPPWDYPDVAGYDCIEVWNGPWQADNEAALAFWAVQLARGRRVAAVGGSDFHRRREMAAEPPRAPGTPTTWAFVSGPPGAASLLEALRRGHLSLSAAPDGPFVDLRAGPAGGAPVMASDVLAVQAPAEPAVSIRCLRGTGHLLRLVDQAGILFEHVISEPDQSLAPRLALAGSLFVRAELRDQQGAMRALTNPIYLRHR